VFFPVSSSIPDTIFSKQLPHSIVACTPKNQVRLYQDNVMVSEHLVEQVVTEENE